MNGIKIVRLLDILAFPPIRETDNKQAKKQTIETYMEICEEFLNKAEENIEKLSVFKGPSTDLVHSDSPGMYQKMLQILEASSGSMRLIIKNDKGI